MCRQSSMDKAKSYIEMPKLIPKNAAGIVTKIRKAGKSRIVILYAFQRPGQNGIPDIGKVMLPVPKTALKQ